jgi:hypothetical protein
MAKWIEFVEWTAKAGAVTRQWEIRAKQSGTPLGTVAWYTGWRRYVFRPYPDTEYEQDCLRDVANFLEAQTREHKARRASEAACPEPAGEGEADEGP